MLLENNWYVSFRNVGAEGGPTPAKFWVWDAEYCLTVQQGGFPLTRGAYIRDVFINNPGLDEPVVNIWHALFANADFRSLFVARVDELTASNGLLSDNAAIERWDKLSDFIYSAIIGETARWGDVGKSLIQPFQPVPSFYRKKTRDGAWQDEVDSVRDALQGNRDNFIQVLTDAGFYGNDLGPTDLAFWWKCTDELPCTALDLFGFEVPGNRVKVDLFGFFCFDWCDIVSNLLLFLPCGSCS